MKKKILLGLSICLLIGTLQLTTNGATISFDPCPNQNPYHILVNKQHTLSSSYKPSNLVIPKVAFESPGNIQKNHMEATAARALEKMFAGAKAQNIRLVAVSGYRSYSRQSTLYQNALTTYGNNQQGTAKPGTSEHQTGLAMDINSISQSFEHTKEGKWLAQNAHLYGFIIRYPKGKTHITGYIYEPWHVRYVGPELAKYCYTNNLTLEEVTTCCSKDESIEMIIRSSSKPDGVTHTLLRRDNTTYIKVRDLLEHIGGNVSTLNGQVTLTSNHTELLLKENVKEILVNATPMTLSHAPLLLNYSYYVPMRSLLNALSLGLDFIDATTLSILTPLNI